MPFIDDESLKELKTRIWYEGYDARCDDFLSENPYEIEEDTSSEPINHNYCPEGGCNED